MKPAKENVRKSLRKKKAQNNIQTLQRTCRHAGAHMK